MTGTAPYANGDTGEVGRAALVGVWVAGTVAATSVGWAAVGLVTDEIGPQAPLPLPQVAIEGPADVDGAPRASEPAAEAADPARTGAPDPARTETFDLAGGTVAVGYRREQARLLRATPRTGFVVEINDPGPGKVDVRFRSDDHDSRLVVEYADGAPQVRRDEG